MLCLLPPTLLSSDFLGVCVCVRTCVSAERCLKSETSYPPLSLVLRPSSVIWSRCNLVDGCVV